MDSNPEPAAPSLLRSSSWTLEQRPLEVIFGAGAVAQLGECARKNSARRVLVVTDPGIAAAGHVEATVESLSRTKLAVEVFDRVRENPTERDVAAGTEVAKKFRPDLIVGLGGGSAMDCAKGVNFIYTNGGKMEDYWGFNKADRALLPAIGIPCTAGTGSEAQSFAVISRQGDHRKMACGDEKARFRTVVLDPHLAATAPVEVAAVTGLDAISHAIESSVTTAGNAFSDAMADGAWVKLDRNYETIVSGRASEEEWGEMLIGAHLAGTAIEFSMLGAAHALANPLTARYDLAHGLAVALVLPAVVRYNGENCRERYAQLLGARGARADGMNPVETLARRLIELRGLSGLPTSLSDAGVVESALPELADQAVEQWTGGFNPRPVQRDSLLELYRQSF
jgi:alcohol dehydrogenase